MKKRLSRIITRSGDKGSTSLADGSRLSKQSARIEAMGCVDELNSFVGLFLSELDPQSELYDSFLRVQNDLFDLGGELAMPGNNLLEEAQWQSLEQLTEHLNADLPALENFILPGGSRLISLCHVVRSVARRAERRVIALAEQEDVNPASRIYLNRLSDVSFVAARWLAKVNNEDEVLWEQRPKP